MSENNENEHLAPANIAGRLDQIQNTMNLVFGHIGTANTTITQNTQVIAQVKQDIAQISRNTTLICQLMTKLIKQVDR